MLKRCCSILLLFCILLTAAGCGSAELPADVEPSAPAVSPEGPAPTSPTPTPEASPAPELTQRERDWIADLNYLRRHYKLYHKDPFYYCAEEEFDFKLDQLSGKVGELSDNEIIFEIAAIIAGMGDIHTSVSFPASLFASFFPVDVLPIGDKLYLAAYLEGYDQFEPYLLREVVAVNGVDASYLLKQFDRLISPDNTWYAREAFSRYYALYPAFYDWAGCDHTEGYTFQILNEKGAAESVEVPVLFREELEGDATWVRATGIDSLRYFKGGNWAEYFREETGDYIYVSFTEMLSINKAYYRELFEAAAELIAAHPDCGKLVIDLRGHPGGQASMFDDIREYAALLNVPSIKQTYVLTGGYTTSAAIGCVSIFKEELNAVTVGEPTGQFTSFFAFSGGGIGVRVVLPISQLIVTVANVWAEGLDPENELYDENGKLYRWENTVLPDVFVSQNIADVRRGKDSVIQWILEQG